MIDMCHSEEYIMAWRRSELPGLLGPILGRFFVDYGGRNAYASLMLAVSILSCKLGGLGWIPWMAERCEGEHMTDIRG